MTRYLLAGTVAGLLFAGIAAAAESPLTGADNKALFSGARVIGADWSQGFHADGRTRYERAGETTAGRWRVDGERYCPQWPTNPAWRCYTVQRRGAGDAVFVI